MTTPHPTSTGSGSIRVVKLRVSGTRGDCRHLVGCLSELFAGAGVADVAETSEFRPSHGPAAIGRIYLEIHLI